jgi:hypothetical protein
MEVHKKSCTVLTAGGDFRVVRMKGDFRPGQEIELPERSAGILKYALTAACLAFIIIAAGLWKFWTLPAVAAYVCLDINPSVEMALDGDSIVRKVNPLNEDGKVLVAGLAIEGKGVREAVEELIEAAAAKNYIQPGEEAVVMSSVIPTDQGDPALMDQAVKESIENSLKKQKVKAQVVVLNATPDVREEAGKAGMSTGRYMLYLNARERGDDASPADFKNKSIRSIEKEHKLKINEISERNLSGREGRWNKTVRPAGSQDNRSGKGPGGDDWVPAGGKAGGGKGDPPGRDRAGRDNSGRQGGWGSQWEKQQGGEDRNGDRSPRDNDGKRQYQGKDSPGQSQKEQDGRESDHRWGR